MTKKHFEVLAFSIKRTVDAAEAMNDEHAKGRIEGIVMTVNALTDVLANENPRFNRERFLTVCGTAMNTFTKRHEGEAVVYNHPDGGSVSATILTVTPGQGINLRFAVPYNYQLYRFVGERDYDRLTLFGNSKFLCV